jgi:hypothetical protein
MPPDSTRREFIKIVTASGAAAAWSAGGSPRSLAADGSFCSQDGLDGNVVDAEIRQRARGYVRQRRLVVDYYRVGRQLAYPLPLKSLPVPDVPVPGIASYPWATWLSWTLEERIGALGWAAEWFADGEARNAAATDLAALTAWPHYETGLCSAHTGRILWTAATRWTWVGGDLRHKLREACRRHMEPGLAASEKLVGTAATKVDILRQKTPHARLHNIGLISTVGAALTAAAAQHPARSVLNARVTALFEAVLELRAGGFSEGVAYDGYVLDFIADWLGTLPEKDRSPILEHPHLGHFLDESIMLSAPAAAAQVAELGDVEPREMPFHLSAQAKLLNLHANPAAAWHLARCPAGWIRTDGLAAIRLAKHDQPTDVPPAGAMDAHYAAVLRSGWETDDLAVAVSCTTSPMGHLPRDNGTIVLGTQGNWLITDPGYQQYAKGDEQDFTVGPTAHNAPVINGAAQTQKRPRRTVLENEGPNLHHVAVDLAACYPPAVAVTTLVRHVWLADKNLVVVADQMEGKDPLQATYHWHGHSNCAWWFEDNWAGLTLGGVQLWFTCAQATVSGANLHRLPGSRGQLSLVCRLDEVPPVVWWVFALGYDRPVLHAAPDWQQMRIRNRTFSL